MHQKPKPDSDLVKLVRKLEEQRAQREELRKQVQRIEQDLDKVLQYYETEKRKLELQSDATFREIRVKDVEIANTEEVLASLV